MKDPEATVIRNPVATDPDATVKRPVVARRRGAEGRLDAASTQFPPTRTFAGRDGAPEPDRDPTAIVTPRTSMLAAALARTGADATTVQLPRAEDSDATVLRDTLVRPRGVQADDDRTLERGTTLRPLPKRSLALVEGTLLHEYRIERVLGQGGFGITYLATDANLDAKVAIKEYLPEEIAFRASDASVSPNASTHRDRYRQGLENFLTEARTLATFRHPNIVRVARFFEAHQTAYMVLEYERGKSFKKWWLKQARGRAQSGQGERLLVERLQPLLDGLSAVHAAGYLHRDIKPDNIQVRAEDGRLVLLDFGSAGQTVALADQDAVVVTPGYAPVEQYGIGEQGAWTDIYAMGATLYWAVTGSKPPDAEARAGGVEMEPAAEAGKGRFGRSFLEAIDWALQMDPAARPQTIDAWRDKLLADHVSSLGLKEALRREDSMFDSQAAAAAHDPLRARLRHWWRRVLAPSAWSLPAKLSLAMLVTALMPMLATGLYNLDGAQGALETAQLRKTELIAHNTAGRVAQLLADSTRLTRGLGGDGELARWLAASDDKGFEVLQQRLQALAAANPDIDHVMVMDAGGAVRLSTDLSLLGQAFAFRDYFKEAMAGRSHTTGIVIGATAGTPGVFFSEPIRDASGQAQAAVVLRLHGRAFWSILEAVRHDSDLTPFMVDADGVLLYHPNTAMMYRSLAPLDEAAQQRIRADRRFRRDRVDSVGETALARAMREGGRSGRVAYRSSMSGVDEIAGFAPVPGHDWTVLVSQSRQAFEQPIVQLQTVFYVSLALVGLLFAGLALHFARGIVRPVHQLTAGAHALKSGQFEKAYVDVKGRDELGQLARTFNVMIDVLRQRERERDTRRG